MTDLVESSRVQSNIDLPRDKVAAFCRRWNVAEFALIGSVLRGDFRPDSDVDVLVSFAPDAHRSLSDFLDMQLELSEMFGRNVDLVERGGLHNPFMRQEILNSLEHPLRPADPDLAYLWDIREAALRVQRHVRGSAWEGFKAMSCCRTRSRVRSKSLGRPHAVSRSVLGTSIRKYRGYG